MATLVVSHRVPLARDADLGSLIFEAWLPDGPGQALMKKEGNLTVRVWVDKTCVDSLEDVTDAFISRSTDVRVTRLLVDVEVRSVAEELAAFIRDHADWPTTGELTTSSDPAIDLLAKQYHSLGQEVLEAVLSTTNRLISWAYAERGQYWMLARPEDSDTMMSRNNEFDAKVSIDDGQPVRWCPPNPDSFAAFFVNSERFLKPSDWPVLARFVPSDARPDLVGELLSNADALLAWGHTRSAVIEAISALEIALYQFARRPRRDLLRTDRSFSNANFVRDVEKLGVSVSVRHLLPLLFDAEAVPGRLLEECDLAIASRNSMVHGGQRLLDDHAARGHVYAVRRLVKALKAATIVRDEPRDTDRDQEG